MSADETPQPNNAASANNAPHPETYREGKLDVRRVAMITNPKAGKGRSGDKLAKARNRLVELGVDVVHMQGASAEASRELAAEAVADDAIDAIACCGGPGVDGHWFGTIAMAGFDSLVTERTNQISWPTGKMRYVAAIGIEFAKFHSLPTRLVIERDLVLDENLTMVAIGNTRTYGGGMKVCPTADPADGMLNVTVL